MLNRIVKTVADHNLNLYSIAVMDADGIHECRHRRADLCTNSYSVAKVFTMTAIGMLHDAGRLRVQDRVIDIFRDELPDGMDERWGEATVEHLLTHRVGLPQGFLDIDVDDLTRYPTDDFLHYVLSTPLQQTPGEKFVYSDAAFYLLARIVTKITGERLDDFLRPTLFGTMGFRELAWSVCPRGYCMGATGLYIRTADMVKLGYAYANDGCYGGKRVVSADWVKLALERKYELSPYGSSGIYTKGGMYGQLLCLSPERRIAFGWHGYETANDVRIVLKQFDRT
jgi:CubicO group peptidase (beta-lactamase class C family)